VRIDSATENVCSPSTSRRNHCRRSERRSTRNGEILPNSKRTHDARNRASQLIVVQGPDENNSNLFRQTQTHHRSSSLFQLTDIEATTAGPRCSESCRSVDCCPSTCKVDENNSERSALFRTDQRNTFVASVPTHREKSDDSWPTVLGIEPLSRLPANDLQNRRNQQ
jgi:hypothetical protein